MAKRERHSARISRLDRLNGGKPSIPDSEDSENDDIRPSKRPRAKVSYDENAGDNSDAAENASNDEIPSTSEEDDGKDASDDYVEDDNVSRSRRRKLARKSHAVASSDGDFDESDIASDPDDDFLEKLQEKNFVEDDDDDASDHGYGMRPKRSKPKSRSRSRSIEPRGTRLTRSKQAEAEQKNDDDDDDDDDSIHKEIQDLYDSSPDNSPVNHKLRERRKIDYTIPPPLTNEQQLDTLSGPLLHMPVPRGRPRRNNNEFRKLLFPTAGPFGGSDVTSLFGTNIPPGGIPIPGMTNDSNLTAIGQNISDSDSSDDEIAPINGEATVSKKTKILANGNILNNTKLIPAGTSNEKDKKKNSLSDTDPLGVDMNIDFSVVGGLDNYIDQLKEMVALPLLYPELYQNFSITPPRGVLFHGPPGTGKTLMARALAASCSTSTRKITFFMRKGADCLSKWVGEAERQLRLLFEEAKNQQPSIIFFDEIDGLAPVRSSKQEQIHASIVSTLLALMDGMDNRGQVIVIGATNRPDSVDPALRRPGRFDREFYFPLPDINARSDILKIHTRKWSPPLPSEFLDKVAGLTKGYGGADLRALCTEAALNSIQRKYPQIYKTNDKLQVDPTKVKVIAKDFMQAIDKIIPSSARSTSSGSAPLPNHLKALLETSFEEITEKLNDLLPNSISVGKRKKLTTLDDALYLDPTIKDSDGGFSKQELLKNLENSRICKPHLLISGGQGSGQQYISAAILNYLEGFQVQSLDLGNIFGDATRTPELCIVQTFIEAKRHQPSIILIPNIDIWFQVMPYSAKATLTSLLRNLKSTEKVLLLGISETRLDELETDIKIMFGFDSTANNVHLNPPTAEERIKFFESVKKTLLMKPYEFVNDLENRPKRKLKVLKVVQPTEVQSDSKSDKKLLKQQEYQDTKLKNVLKIKLAGLMDLFKNRYKRFKKPIIDENFLYHLFDPSVLQNPLIPYEVAYEKSTDPEHTNMIKEVSTGKYYHNMDLDVIEERLWNGYYSEAKQFLKDIKMIVKDSITSGDRDKILKANEMLTNAQFGIDDFNTADFAKACREMRAREAAKQEKILKEHKRLEEEFRRKQAENLTDLSSSNVEVNGINENDSVLDLDSPEVPIADDTTEVHVSNGTAKMDGIKKDIVDGDEANGNAVSEGQAIGGATENDEVNGNAIEEDEVNGGGPTGNDLAENSKPKDGDISSTDNIPADGVDLPESESEAEEELAHDTSRAVVIKHDIEEFFSKTVTELTANFSIEKLEITMAKFMDVVWSDRSKWDRTETFEKLLDTSKELKATMG